MPVRLSRIHKACKEPYMSYLQAGPVIRVHLPHLYPGVHKGYAFCQYKSMVGHFGYDQAAPQSMPPSAD